MTNKDLLCDPARSGVYRLPETVAWVSQVTAADFAFWRVDLAKVRSKAGLLAAVAKALDFPDWFGHNWDALQDCLTDLSWRPAPGYAVVLENCREFAECVPADFEAALEVFVAAVDFWRERAVPFWVLIGGLADLPYSLPRLDRAE
jgi:RNAse (barnase) inhibitor barstar